jgi:hypothetical protein
LETTPAPESTVSRNADDPAARAQFRSNVSADALAVKVRKAAQNAKDPVFARIYTCSDKGALPMTMFL